MNLSTSQRLRDSISSTLLSLGKALQSKRIVRLANRIGLKAHETFYAYTR